MSQATDKPNPIPSIALIGRTNVGKSTLFNRLTETQKAMVSDVAGTTRDRLEGDCLWRGKIVKIVDTGGLDVDQESVIERDVVKQARIALQKCDVIFFVIDAKEGPLPQDLTLAKELKSSGKAVIVVANKAESLSQIQSTQGPDWRLSGLPSAMPISALRGTGTGDLLDAAYVMLEKLKRPPAELSQVKPVRIAVIGQPNVGKSSLLNAILGEERFIVSPIAHTTRDPNDVAIDIGDRHYVLVDTAGMRKMHKVREKGGLEREAVERTQGLLRNTDIVLFVLDASQPLASQERTLAGMIASSNVGIIIVMNKWDLIPNKTSDTINDYERMLERQLPFLTWAPVLFVSALTTKRVVDIFETIDVVQSHRYANVEDSELDSFIRKSIRRHLPSRGKGPAHPTILGLVQTGMAPPTFHLTIKAKRTDVLHPSYLRYLENRLREFIDISGTPIEIKVKTASSVSLRK